MSAVHVRPHPLTVYRVAHVILPHPPAVPSETIGLVTGPHRSRILRGHGGYTKHWRDERATLHNKIADCMATSSVYTHEKIRTPRR